VLAQPAQAHQSRSSMGSTSASIGKWRRHRPHWRVEGASSDTVGAFDALSRSSVLLMARRSGRSTVIGGGVMAGDKRGRAGTIIHTGRADGTNPRVADQPESFIAFCVGERSHDRLAAVVFGPSLLNWAVDRHVDSSNHWLRSRRRACTGRQRYWPSCPNEATHPKRASLPPIGTDFGGTRAADSTRRENALFSSLLVLL
jgi:hypothetical protein